MSAVRWYVERDGVEAGPVTWAELQELSRAGQVRPTDLVRREGVPYWQPACEVRGDLQGDRSDGVGEAKEVAAPVPEPAPAAPPVQHAEVPAADPSPVSAVSEVSEVSSPPTGPSDPPPPGRTPAGVAILALMLAVAGLFWFGLLLGGLAVFLAADSLRMTRRLPWRPARGVAVAALLLGVADVLVVTVLLVARLQTHVRLLGRG